MYFSDIKKNAFLQKDLLERDVRFKSKFYYSGTAGYDTAKLGTMRLMPKSEDMDALRNDYEQMKNMFFGNIPDFDEMMEVIQILEKEINLLV